MYGPTLLLPISTSLIDHCVEHVYMHIEAKTPRFQLSVTNVTFGAGSPFSFAAFIQESWRGVSSPDPLVCRGGTWSPPFHTSRTPGQRSPHPPCTAEARGSKTCKGTLEMKHVHTHTRTSSLNIDVSSVVNAVQLTRLVNIDFGRQHCNILFKCILEGFFWA